MNAIPKVQMTPAMVERYAPVLEALSVLKGIHERQEVVRKRHDHLSFSKRSEAVRNDPETEGLRKEEYAATNALRMAQGAYARSFTLDEVILLVADIERQWIGDAKLTAASNFIHRIASDLSIDHKFRDAFGRLVKKAIDKLVEDGTFEVHLAGTAPGGTPRGSAYKHRVYGSVEHVEAILKAKVAATEAAIAMAEQREAAYDLILGRLSNIEDSGDTVIAALGISYDEAIIAAAEHIQRRK